MSPRSIRFWLFPAPRRNNPSITAKVIVAQDKPIPAEDEGQAHNLRVCRVGPDDKLYISLGQPYNVPPTSSTIGESAASLE